ncbi:hypothetical protein Tco_0739204 [Tanacetum coccineum]
MEAKEMVTGIAESNYVESFLLFLLQLTTIEFFMCRAMLTEKQRTLEDEAGGWFFRAASLVFLQKISDVQKIIPNPAPSTTSNPPLRNQLEILFHPMFDEYFKEIPKTVSPDNSVATRQDAPSSTTIDLDAHSPTTTPIIDETRTPITSNDVEEKLQENPNA